MSKTVRFAKPLPAKDYTKKIDLLYPNLPVTFEYPADDFMLPENPIARNTTLFINQVKYFNRRYELDVYDITHECLRDIALD